MMRSGPLRALALFIATVGLVACAASPEKDLSSLAALPERFPHSMKGYVLYGWERADEEWFTLVTGTNRLKTFEELDDPVHLTGDDGFVRVRVQGLAAARELLRRVPDSQPLLLGVDHPSVAGTTLPADVRALDMAALLPDLLE